MKHIFLFALFVSLFLTASSQDVFLDSTFGVKGRVVTSVTSGVDKAWYVRLQSDQKIVVAGSTNSATTGLDAICLRYNTNGSLDTTFGNGGKVQLDVQLGSEDVAYSVAIQNDGKILLAGYSDDGTKRSGLLMRLKTDGTVDSSFGQNGIVLASFAATNSDAIADIKINLNGKISGGGTSRTSSTRSRPVFMRFNTDGTFDSTFNNVGFRFALASTRDLNSNFSVERILLLSNGKMVGVGIVNALINPTVDYDTWTAKCNSDGTMDSTYGKYGETFLSYNSGGVDLIGVDVALTANNNYAIAGYSSNWGGDFYLTGTYTDGSIFTGTLYRNFGDKGQHPSEGYAVEVDDQGSLVMCGAVYANYSATSPSNFGVTRTKSNFTYDEKFAMEGEVEIGFPGSDYSVGVDLAIQQDGKIVVAGNTGNDIGLIRLFPNLYSIFPPILTQPQNNSPLSSLNSNLYWNNTNQGFSYTIEIDESISFTNPTTLNSTSFSVPAGNLQPSKIYYWRVKATDGVVSSAWSEVWKFTTPSISAINNLGEFKNINVYPNPTSGILKVDLFGLTDTEIKIEVIEITGRVVKEFSLDARNETIHILDVSNLNNGSYLIRILGKDVNQLGKFQLIH